MINQTDPYDPNYDFYLRVINDPIFWLVLAVTEFILVTVIVTGNSFLLFTTYKDPRKSLRSPPSLLIANLSASDLLLGLFSVSLLALKDILRYKHVDTPVAGVFKVVIYIVLITTLFVTSYSIIAMSVTFHVAINKPMEYKSIITKRIIKIYIAVLWLISLLTCILPVTNVSEKTYTMIYLHTHASLPAILLTVIYVKVFRALARRTRELQLNGSDSIANSARILERKRKMTITFIIILAMFYISYMPQYITLHLLHFCTSCQQSTTFHKIDVVLSRFLFINSAINPFIYAWRVPKYRRAFIDCWRMLLNKPKRTSQLNRSLVTERRQQTVREIQVRFLRNTGGQSNHEDKLSDATSV